MGVYRIGFHYLATLLPYIHHRGPNQRLCQALAATSGNRTQAAKILGIDRVSLWRKLKKLGIDSE